MNASRSEHVYFVDDVHLVKRVTGGREGGVGDELAGLIDRAVAGGVDFDDVQIVAAHDGLGHALLDVGGGVLMFRGGIGVRCLGAGLGAVGHGVGRIERAGIEAGHGGLAHAAGAGEQVGMGDAASGDGAAEGLGDALLPDDVAEGLGTVASCKDGIGHKRR